MDQLLADANVPGFARQIAKSMGWGVGKVSQTISLDGNVIEIVEKMPTKSPGVMKFVVDSPDWQKTLNCDGKPLYVKGIWDGNVLVQQAAWDGMRLFVKDGDLMPKSRRWVDSKSGEMVISASTSTGEVVLRFFTKQSA